MILQFDQPIAGNLQQQPSLNNGNLQNLTYTFSDLRSSQKSIREKQVLDSAIPRQLLSDFEKMLKKQATFFRKVKSMDRPLFQ